jgi:phasin family protein
MTTLQEQFSALNERALQSALEFASISIENTERLVGFQIESAKASLEESAEHVRALTTVRDTQDLVTLRTKLVEASVERATDYVRTVYELAVEAQSRVSELVEAQVAAFNEGLVNAAETAAQSVPGGGEVALAAVKSSVAATNAAVDTLNRTAKQAAKLTDNAVKSTVGSSKGAKSRKTA